MECSKGPWRARMLIQKTNQELQEKANELENTVDLEKATTLTERIEVLQRHKGDLTKIVKVIFS